MKPTMARREEEAPRVIPPSTLQLTHLHTHNRIEREKREGERRNYNLIESSVNGITEKSSLEVINAGFLWTGV